MGQSRRQAQSVPCWMLRSGDEALRCALPISALPSTPMPDFCLARRLVLASLAAPLLQGCAVPLSALPDPADDQAARALLAASARAHGLSALAAIDDISVGYAGSFHDLVDRLQPELVDAGHRNRAEDRLLLRERLAVQAQIGPRGAKQVVRDARAGTVRVWFEGVESLDEARRGAAALVADYYGLFLLGPMLLGGPWADGRTLAMALLDGERVTVGGTTHECDVLRIDLTPGLGFAARDELALYIDREQRLMRRLRFSLNGFKPTRGAVADVDAWNHRTAHGVRWPSQFEERLLRPLPLPVHEWRMTGLDVNRRLDRASVGGPVLTGRAARPATPL